MLVFTRIASDKSNDARLTQLAVVIDGFLCQRERSESTDAGMAAEGTSTLTSGKGITPEIGIWHQDFEVGVGSGSPTAEKHSLNKPVIR